MHTIHDVYTYLHERYTQYIHISTHPYTHIGTPTYIYLHTHIHMYTHRWHSHWQTRCLQVQSNKSRLYQPMRCVVWCVCTVVCVLYWTSVCCIVHVCACPIIHCTSMLSLCTHHVYQPYHTTYTDHTTACGRKWAQVLWVWIYSRHWSLSATLIGCGDCRQWYDWFVLFFIVFYCFFIVACVWVCWFVLYTCASIVYVQLQNTHHMLSRMHHTHITFPSHMYHISPSHHTFIHITPIFISYL